MQQRTETLLDLRRAGADITHQLKGFALRPEFFQLVRVVVDAHEEPGNRNVENLCYLPKATCGNTICATFIFLQLLKCKAELIRKSRLAQAAQHTTNPHPAAHVYVNRIGTLLA